MATYRNNGIDVWLLRELGVRALVSCLEELSGKKDLIIDKTLMKLLDRLAQATTLRKHDVDKIYRLERIPPNASSNQRVYLTRSCPEVVKLITEHIAHQQQQDNKLIKVLLVCVPRITHSVRSLIEEEGLGGGGLVSLIPFNPGFVPIDDDLLTFEMPTFFKDAYIEGDFSTCVGIGQGLSLLQSVYGAPNKILAHGRGANTVIKTANLFTQSQGNEEDNKGQKCSIGQLFIFDRDADFITPLLTQLTYEGSIDEHFNIQAGVVDLPESVTSASDSEKKIPSKLMLHSKDAVFENIRHKHFAGVAGQLVRNAKEVQERKESSKRMTPSQMKDFVATELKELQSKQGSISLHLTICEAITNATRRDFEVQLTTEHGLITGATPLADAKNYFEEICARQLPLSTCVRLLCLISLSQNNGLSSKEFETLSSYLVAACGYKHLNTLFELKQAGLLITSDSIVSPTDISNTSGSMAIKGLRQAASNLMNRDHIGKWRSVCKSLKLIPDPEEVINLHNPNHLSFVFNGAYTPVLPQIVNLVLTKGLGSIAESVKYIPGTSYTKGWDNEEDKVEDHTIPPVVLVIILGGVTFAEIAAFRLLGLKTGNRFIIASTGTMTGNKLINSIVNSNSV